MWPCASEAQLRKANVSTSLQFLQIIRVENNKEQEKEEKERKKKKKKKKKESPHPPPQKKERKTIEQIKKKKKYLEIHKQKTKKTADRRREIATNT